MKKKLRLNKETVRRLTPQQNLRIRELATPQLNQAAGGTSNNLICNPLFTLDGFCEDLSLAPFCGSISCFPVTC